MTALTIHRALLLFIVSLVFASACRATAPLEGGVDPARAGEIAPLLPQGPFAFGPPISDRAAWERLATRPAFKGAVAEAEKLMAEPLPEMTEEIYREYSRTGKRTAHTIAMDLRSAYPVPELTRLVRTFTYRRDGNTSLTVSDDFSFTSPQSFGGALITYGQWKRGPDGAILISQDGRAVSVTVDTGGAAFEVTGETIDEASEAKDHAKPTRIGINLTQPIAAGHVTLTITPAAAR